MAGSHRRLSTVNITYNHLAAVAQCLYSTDLASRARRAVTSQCNGLPIVDLFRRAIGDCNTHAFLRWYTRSRQMLADIIYARTYRIRIWCASTHIAMGLCSNCCDFIFFSHFEYNKTCGRNLRHPSSVLLHSACTSRYSVSDRSSIAPSRWLNLYQQFRKMHRVRTHRTVLRSHGSTSTLVSWFAFHLSPTSVSFLSFPPSPGSPSLISTTGHPATLWLLCMHLACLRDAFATATLVG